MEEICFVGLDINSRPPYYTIIATNAEKQVLLDLSGNWEDIEACLEQFGRLIIAINSPIRPNMGFLIKSHRKKHKPGKWPDERLIEFDLEDYGAPIYHTPKKKGNLLAAQKFGFTLVEKLESSGFQEYKAEVDFEKVYLETPSETAFWSIERKPLFLAESFIGRIQRQLLLLELGIPLPDPMDFFEEITSFKLKSGKAPLDMILELNRLNAWMNAYTTRQLIRNPSRAAKLGYEPEGFLYFPFHLPDWDAIDPTHQDPLF